MQAAELLSNGIGQIQEWLSANRLKLNPSKSELICLGQKRQIKKVMLDRVRVGSDQILRSKVVRNLGVFLDEDLSMADHISRVVSRGFLELRKLRSIITSVTREVALTLVHALVCTRLDYCNSLLAQINVTQLKRLQSLQNAAARLITETRMNQHISPVLCVLHWLPVIFRVKFKIISLVDKCLRGDAPEYLQTECRLVRSSDRAHGLRSCDTRLLVISRTNSKFGDRMFSKLGPAYWNTLPSELRDRITTRDIFLSRLKTFLFEQSAAAL